MNLLKEIIECLEKVNLEDIRIYDMRGRSPFYDYMIISTATSDRQGHAAIDYLEDKEVEQKLSIRAVEGRDSSWELIDTYEVLVHVFSKEDREFYDLDKLYLEVPQIALSEIKSL